MGYTTDFEGTFLLNRPLAPHDRAYLAKFSETRRMKRNAGLAAELPDPIRQDANLPIGPEGAYFVGAPGFMGQDPTEDVLNENRPPEGQPGSWCQWTPNAQGIGLVWTGTEKFYHYVEWLEYLIEHFLSPWGYVLNGRVDYQGEELDDYGTIVVTDNQVSLHEAEGAPNPRLRARLESDEEDA